MRRTSLLLLFGPPFAALVVWACSDNGAVTPLVDGGAEAGEAAAPFDAAGIVVPPDASKPPRDAGSQDTSVPEADVPDVDSGFDAGSCHKVGGNHLCGLSPQCGCSSTETCDFLLGDTRCVGPPGNWSAGTACASTASCGLGLTCLYNGTCHAFCADAGQPCGDASTCVAVVDQDGGVVPELAVCEIPCVLSDPASCGSGAACYPSPHNTTGTDCAPAGVGLPDAGCTYLNDCSPGYGCIGTADSGTGQCQPWCRIGKSDCGDAGLSCTPLNPSLVLAGTQYGSCR